MLSKRKAGLPWNWLVVTAATCMTFGFYGTSGSFGVFLNPMEEAFNLTRASTSAAMSIFMGMTGLTGIVSGRLTDRYGPRIVIGIGTVSGFLGYLLMYWAGSLWQIYLFFGVMAGAAMGTCFTPVIATVSKWFTDKRAMAVGITTIGMAIGHMFLPIITAHFIASSGWRITYLILAGLLLVTSIPAVVLLGRRAPQNTPTELTNPNKKMPQKAQDRHAALPAEWSAAEAIRTLPFWLFVIIGYVTATGFHILLVHIVAYAREIGIPAVDAAFFLTFSNSGSIAAQFLVWFLVRRLSSKATLIMLLSLQALALFLIIGTSQFYWLIILGIIFGFGFGGGNTVRLSMISEVFGTRSAGAIIGLVSVAWAAGGITGPILAGYIFDLSQSYNAAFIIGGLLMVGGVISGIFLRTPAPRTVDMREANHF